MSPRARHRGVAAPGSFAVVDQTRDRAALVSLAWAGILTTPQLVPLHYPSLRVAQRRLRAYLDHGLVRSHAREALHLPAVHTLTPHGLEWLAERALLPASVRRPLRLPAPGKLAHALFVRDIFVAYRRAAAQGAFTLDDFYFDHELAAEPGCRAAGLVPDGLAMLSGPGDARTVFLEADRGTETTRTLGAKFLSWHRAFRAGEGVLGQPDATLQIVGMTATRCVTLARLAQEAGLDGRAEVVEHDNLLRTLGTHPLCAPPVRAARTDLRPETAFSVRTTATGAAAFRPVAR